MKKILSILLLYIMATAASHAFLPSIPTSLFESQVPKVEEVDSGKCGKHVVWKYHARTKALEIYGDGPMWTYDKASLVGRGIPWRSKTIKTLIVREGVKSIAQGVFKSSGELTSVIIPGSVKRIGKSAFEDCRKLTYVVITNGVKEIGEKAFADCQNIWTISIPNSVKIMENHAFFNCKTLRTVNLSNSLKTIAHGAFLCCENLDSLEIPEGVESIESLAFYKCRNLTTITLPKSLDSIGEGALGRTMILYGVLEHPAAVRDKEAFNDNPFMYDESSLYLDEFMEIKRRAEEYEKK